MNTIIQLMLITIVISEARIHEQLSLYTRNSSTSEPDLVCMVSNKKWLTIANNNSNLQEWILPLGFNYAAPFYSTWVQYVSLSSFRPEMLRTVAVDFNSFFNTFGQKKTNWNERVKIVFCIDGAHFYNGMFNTRIVISSNTQMSEQYNHTIGGVDNSFSDPCCRISLSLVLLGYLLAVGCSGGMCLSV